MQRIHRILNKVQAGTLGDKWPPGLSLTLRFSVNTAEIIFIVMWGLGNRRKSWGLQKARNQMWDASIKRGPHPQCKANKKNNLTGKKETARKTCIRVLPLVPDVVEKDHLKICDHKLNVTWIYRVFWKGKCKLMVLFKMVPCCKAPSWLRDANVNLPWKNSNSIQAPKNSCRWRSNKNETFTIKQNHKTLKGEASSVRIHTQKHKTVIEHLCIQMIGYKTDFEVTTGFSRK